MHARDGSVKKISLIAGLLLSAGYVLAVNPVALWMPVSLQGLMPQLMQAAEMAEATERCDKVMSGRHSSKRSTPERPVFSIICRDATTRRTYNILYAVENGQIVEVNEQQRIEDGQAAARPWENPALKPVNPATQPVAATSTSTLSSSIPAAATASTPAPLPSLPAAPVQIVQPAPVVREQPVIPSPSIDNRLSKLMARLEAAGVKGASAKVMMEDMQRKTLEEQLGENQSQQLSEPAMANPDIAAAPVNAINAVPAQNSINEQTSAENAVPAPSIAESVSNAISTQLWTQCLPAIKEKTASMIDRVLDEKNIPQGYSGDAGSTNMDVPFEAKNPEGMNLRFTAVCTVDAAGIARVKLHPRRE
jgi:hypothetical protein